MFKQYDYGVLFCLFKNFSNILHHISNLLSYIEKKNKGKEGSVPVLNTIVTSLPFFTEKQLSFPPSLAE